MRPKNKNYTPPGCKRRGASAKGRAAVEAPEAAARRTPRNNVCLNILMTRVSLSTRRALSPRRGSARRKSAVHGSRRYKAPVVTSSPPRQGSQSFSLNTLSTLISIIMSRSKGSVVTCHHHPFPYFCSDL